MFDFTDSSPNVDVREVEYVRLLGYPIGHELNGRARELASVTRAWYEENGNPWMCALQIDELDLSGGNIRLKDVKLESGFLHKQLSDASACGVVLVAASAGSECEQRARDLWLQEKPDEYFFMEVYGSAVVEHLITAAASRICAWADTAARSVLPRYSPGYPGWQVSDQHQFLRLMGGCNGGCFPGRLSLLDSGMLVPKKSQIALFGISEHVQALRDIAELTPCARCALPGCQYRRRPHVVRQRQIEDVQDLRSRRDGHPSVKRSAERVLSQNGKYSTSVRALKKWMRERLQLEFLDDSSVSARFRYEGTTCSNLGYPLAFDYHIRLGAKKTKYAIQEMRCLPSPGHDGYTRMCEYIRDPASLMSSIDRERPLLGRPLDDVLAWERLNCPAGCYCGSDSREHKWGLALEALHYALVQHENQTVTDDTKST